MRSPRRSRARGFASVATALGAAAFVACVAPFAVDADTETARADFAGGLVAAAMARTRQDVRYDGSYRSIAYPGGDVPADVGVCTDVVIRTYRAVGVDLQQAVHEDMSTAFADYPALWGLRRPDSNIDHRRVPNLGTFFERQGAALAVTGDADDYHAGDLVTWMLPGNLPHIGIVVSARSTGGERALVVHNIGAGPELEDVLFGFPVTGHYRYAGPSQEGDPRLVAAHHGSLGSTSWLDRQRFRRNSRDDPGTLAVS